MYEFFWQALESVGPITEIDFKIKKLQRIIKETTI